MGLLDFLFKRDQPQQQKPPMDLIAAKIKEMNTKDGITRDDLYIYEGVTRRLNVDKLEWCLSQGIDNEYVREAIREKESTTKMDTARANNTDQAEILYQKTSAESKKYNILRSDDPETKKEKKAKKEMLWEKYHKEKAKLEAKKDASITVTYGERFFADLAEDEDAIGWMWNLSSKPDSCSICRKNVGKYPKGKGPKFPAHDGCTCNLSIVYVGESLR